MRWQWRLPTRISPPDNRALVIKPYSIGRAARYGVRKGGGSHVTIEVYGIPNCDTVKKARAWLDAQGIAYAFHDFKKQGADRDRLAAWADSAGWAVLLNTRGTTFRKLPEADRSGIDSAKALALMAEHTSLIKRPVVEYAGGLLVGFDPDRWAKALSGAPAGARG